MSFTHHWAWNSSRAVIRNTGVQSFTILIQIARCVLRIHFLMKLCIFDQVVMDSFALPVEGTETRVNAQAQAYEYMTAYIEAAKQVKV